MVKPPEAIADAMGALEKRRGELTAAQTAHRRAQREIAQARARDTAQIAEALDSGRKRPGRQEEARATKAAEEAALELEVCQERVKRAGERLDAALEAEGAAWVESVEESAGAADERAVAAVAELEGALSARNTALAVRTHVQRLADARTRPMAVGAPMPTSGPGVISGLPGANGDPLDAGLVVAKLREHIEGTGVEQVRSLEQAQQAYHQRVVESGAARDQETATRQEADQAAAESRDLRRWATQAR